MNIILLLCIFLGSCNKEDDIPITPVDPPDSIQVLWKHYLNPDSSSSSTGKILLDGEKLYYVNAFYKPQSLIQSRELATGNLVWTYDNIQMGEVIGEKNIDIINNQFIINSGGYFFNIDCETGSLLVDNPEYKKGMGWYSRMTTFNGSLYSANEINKNGIHFVDLCRRSYNKIDWEVLYHEEQGPEGYEKGLTSPSFYNTLDGDTILLFANRMWHFPNSKGRADFIAYSLRDRQVLWRVDSVDYNSSVIPPIVFEDKAIFRGDDEIICYEVLSGKEIWRFSMPTNQEDVLLTGAILHEGRYYVQGSNFKNLYCLDARTGKKLWTNNDNGGEACTLHYFDGQIIFSSHFWLVSVDAISGKTIWKRRAKDFGMIGNFNGWMPIGLNARDSVIYACDGREIAALKIPSKK